MKQIRREAEDSLRRLQVEAIDLYQVHWPEPDEDIEEGWATMADLQREGKVRWIGVLQLFGLADEARRADRSDHLESATLLHAQPHRRG